LGGAQLLALDACVSCGRCQDACPAFAAGKPLSPRDLVQTIRAEVDRLDFAQLSATPEAGEGHSLGATVIAAETLWACTTCGACVQSCPVEVAPLEFITDLRRDRVAEGALRGPPAAALQKTQRSGNPWGLPQADRFKWAQGLDVPAVVENPDFEILYWVGCAASYDPRAGKVARALVGLLEAAGVNFACLGPEERCSGDAARRMGDEFLFQELATANIETLQRHQVRRIVTHCPHCLNALSRDYAAFGGGFEVIHHTQLLDELIGQGRLSCGGGSAAAGPVTYHDPCYLARINGVVDAPRRVVDAARGGGADELREMPRRGCGTACCGGGGGRMWFEDAPDGRIGGDRIREALDTGAGTIAVSCPFCLTMMTDGVAAKDPGVVVKDVAEILAQGLKG
jgi:Fe-S oxidoreductase